jgi:rod shape-determining protein MreC
MSRASERQKQKYAPWMLGFLLLTQLALMASTARRVSPESGEGQSVLRGWVLSVVAPIQSGVGSLFSGVGSLWSGYVDLRGVRDRNASLEGENAELRGEIEAARAMAAENERLRRELELRPRLKYSTVAAEVVARDATGWFKVITINKGSQAGIRPNQPVVTPDGLVGRVTAVGLYASNVQLITDEHAGVGAQLTSSRALGELKGKGDGRCRLKSISSIQTVAEEEPILTSGLDRIYPAGILIGYVETYTPGGGASPHDITVRPAADLDRVEHVLVLDVEPQDLTIPEKPK